MTDKKTLEKLNRLNGGGISDRMMQVREEAGLDKAEFGQDKFDLKAAEERTRQGNRVLDKMRAAGLDTTSKDVLDGNGNRRSMNNLGKYLHPKKGVPADKANNTVDANTGGAKVRATQ